METKRIVSRLEKNFERGKKMRGGYRTDRKSTNISLGYRRINSKTETLGETSKTGTRRHWGYIYMCIILDIATASQLQQQIQGNTRKN